MNRSRFGAAVAGCDPGLALATIARAASAAAAKELFAKTCQRLEILPGAFVAGIEPHRLLERLPGLVELPEPGERETEIGERIRLPRIEIDRQLCLARRVRERV